MFGKFFSSTFSGSMIGAGSTVFAVWGYVIANAVNGEVELNPRLLALVIGDTPEAIAEAVEYLAAKDAASRSKEAEGRRIIHETGFLYQVVNHLKYRSILNEDDRKNYFRVKKRESRAKQDKAK